MSETDIIPIETCSHPEIVAEVYLAVNSDYIYHCTACKKKITIPSSTIDLYGKEGVDGIIGLTFGEEWKQRIGKYT